MKTVKVMRWRLNGEGEGPVCTQRAKGRCKGLEVEGLGCSVLTEPCAWSLQNEGSRGLNPPRHWKAPYRRVRADLGFKDSLCWSYGEYAMDWQGGHRGSQEGTAWPRQELGAEGGSGGGQHEGALDKFWRWRDKGRKAIATEHESES